MKLLLVEVGSARFSLPNTFARLIGLALWGSELDVDGYKAVIYVRGSESQAYFKDLCTVAETFIEIARLLFSKCSVGRQLLHPPNSRRLLKLYVHIVPTGKHALFVKDVTFESNHHPLRSALSGNTGHKSHVSAVYHVFGRNWL